MLLHEADADSLGSSDSESEEADEGQASRDDDSDSTDGSSWLVTDEDDEGNKLQKGT